MKKTDIQYSYKSVCILVNISKMCKVCRYIAIKKSFFYLIILRTWNKLFKSYDSLLSTSESYTPLDSKENLSLKCTL